MFDDFFNIVKLRFNGGDEDEVPSFKCPRCQSPIPRDKYEELHRVCPNCNYHGRLPASERIAITVDRGTFRELDSDMISGDPIDFQLEIIRNADFKAGKYDIGFLGRYMEEKNK